MSKSFRIPQSFAFKIPSPLARQYVYVQKLSHTSVIRVHHTSPHKTSFLLLCGGLALWTLAKGICVICTFGSKIYLSKTSGLLFCVTLFVKKDLRHPL